MRTMLLAAAAVVAIGAGSAFAGEGEGGSVNDNVFYNRQVLAQAPARQAPTAVAGNQAVGGAPTASFVTSHRSGTWLFPPADSNG